MVLIVTMRVRVSHSVVRVLVTVLAPRRRLRLPWVGVLMVWVVVRMLVRVGNRVVLMGVGMVRHGDLLPI